MIKLRPAGIEDTPFLFAVYASTRAEELAVLDLTAEQKQQFLEMQFRAQNADYRRRFPNSTHDLILYEGVPAGRVYVARNEQEIRLLDITLLPQYRNKGIGSVILKKLIAEAEQNGKPLSHTVIKFNTPAIRLYQRLGFVIKGEAGHHWLMVWQPAVN